MIELKKIRIALANLEPQLDYVVEQAQTLNQQYQLLLQLYNEVCLERDNLKKELQSLKENDKHNTDNTKS